MAAVTAPSARPSFGSARTFQTEKGATGVIDEALAHLRVDGFCVLEGVIPPGEVDGVRRSVEETVEAEGHTTMTEDAKSLRIGSWRCVAGKCGPSRLPRQGSWISAHKCV